MKYFLAGLHKTFSHKISLVWGMLGVILAALLTSFTSNYKAVLELWNLSIDFITKISLTYKTLLYFYELQTVRQLSLALCMFILFGISISCTYTYMKEKGMNNLKLGMSSGLLGLISAMIGLHCVACGAVMLSFIFSVLGISGSFLAVGASVSQMVGILLLSISIIITAKKIGSPEICAVES